MFYLEIAELKNVYDLSKNRGKAFKDYKRGAVSCVVCAGTSM